LTDWVKVSEMEESTWLEKGFGGVVGELAVVVVVTFVVVKEDFEGMARVL